MKDFTLDNFPVVNKQQWMNQVLLDLKGKDFGSLTSDKAESGFSFFPIYGPEDLPDFSWTREYDNRTGISEAAKTDSIRSWSNLVFVAGNKEKEANAEILFSLEHGASGIILELSGEEDFSLLMNGVLISIIEIWIVPTKDPSKVLQPFLEWSEKSGIPHFLLKGGLLWGGMVKGLKEPIILEEIIRETAALLALGKDYPHFKSICLDATLYHNTGSGTVQEICYTFCHLIDLLDELTKIGLSVEAIFQNLFFRIALGSNFFLEIAKSKIYRILLTRLAGLYQVKLQPESIILFAETSTWTKSALDSDTNLLRNTTEAISAVLGGCQSLWVMPHDSSYRDPDEFSKRLARNLSIILREECHLDKVLDAGAGSFYLGKLLDSLFEKSWEMIQSVEKKGGWMSIYQSGELQESIRVSRNNKFKAILTGENIQVGVNKYINDSRKGDIDFPSLQEEKYQLKPCSWSLPILRIRALVREILSEDPLFNRLEVLDFGKTGTSKERMDFLKNFLEAGGMVVDGWRKYDDNGAEHELLRRESPGIITISADEEIYRVKGLGLVKKIIGNIRDKHLILVGCPNDLIPVFQEFGIQTFIQKGSNLEEIMMELIQATKDKKSK